MSLKPHHVDILRSILERGAIPLSEFDGRVLRPLLRLDLVVETNGAIRVTADGRAAAQEDNPGVAAERPRQPPGIDRLSERQEEVLRHVLRQTGPVLADHLDGRVLRALSSRGLVEESRGWVRPTDSADAYLQSHTRKDRERSRRRSASSPTNARGEAILRAVDELERALPRGAEFMIATFPVYGDDVVSALRKLAREMG